ncbi:MAG: RNA polymerase factor sigma-54, partial [Pseudomonadota bacterium]
ETGDSLQEHLLWQLEMESMPPRDFVIGQTLIDAINEDGYLTDDLPSIQQILLPDITADTEDVLAVLKRVQRFDPVGVGARTLSECLTLQLGQLESDTPALALAFEMVESGLELLGEQRYDQLRKRLAATEEDFDSALALVRSLHPRPGQAVSRSTAQYVVPDVFVRKQDGQWIVDVNGGVTPTIKVNQSYANLIARNGDHSVLRTQLQEARWLVRSLEIRKETLLKVATCIVARQHEFLDHGDEAMRPMVLRDVAEALEMHESTISRVTTNKFMHTPRGVFEFRYFFSSHVGGEDGNETSSIAIRAMIRKLIAKENTKKPLSDNKISQILNDDGINVARRTVAKYREAIGIPSSSERKRLASR